MKTKIDLLQQPIWNYHDVCAYIGCKKSKAYEVMSVCKKRYGGAVIDEPSFVTRDSVLCYCKTSIERELYINEEIQKRKVFN